MHVLTISVSRSGIFSPGVQRCRTLCRKPAIQLWNLESLLRLVGVLALPYCDGCPSQPFASQSS